MIHIKKLLIKKKESKLHSYNYKLIAKEKSQLYKNNWLFFYSSMMINMQTLKMDS